ncbi:MAG: GMC family oxidoreductase [Chloroflexota bacterium]
MKTFDHIVVGAGSAGCVAAATLAKAGRRVALIETGGSDEGFIDALDAGRWKNLVGTEHDYDYHIEPQPKGNSTIRHTRGKILGGTSSINTIIAWRTPDYDLNQWVNLGAKGWEPEAINPLFERIFEQVHIETSSLENPFHHDLVAAAEKAGLDLLDFSPHSTVQNGIGYLYFNKKGRMRQSASVAFLHPLSQWGDELTVFTHTRAIKLLFDGDRVVGVETDRGSFYSDGDLILSAGAFASPTLLMLSGIGPADHLTSVGVQVHHDMVGVGENLLDHPDSMIAWEANRPIPAVDLNAMGMAVFGKTDSSLPVPDMMAHVGTAVFDTYTKPHGYPTAKNGFSFSPNVARARSVGTIRLQSAKPEIRPKIDFRYFTDPYDEFVLTEGIKLSRRIAAQSPLKDWIKRELFPGVKVQTDAEISAYARKVAGTVYHPAGTCKMGAPDDAAAVVDPQLRVRGIQNLRTADASIFPTMIGVNPNITIMMIGMKCADEILGK